MPTVSILMPVCNGAPFLRNALSFLVSQTYSDFEIIISDNASDDETSNIIDEYKKLDSRIHSFRQPERISASDNFCFVLQKSTSPYFMLAAHDDKHDVTFLEKCMNVFRKEKVLGVFTGSIVENYFLNTCVHNHIPLLISENTVFLNFKMYIECLYPSLVYGVFKSEVLECFIRHFNTYRDWSDCVVVYSVFSLGNIAIVHEPLFVAGIVGERRTPKTTRKDGKRVFEYWPFLNLGIKEILFSKKLTRLQKGYLGLLHIRVVTRLFESNERDSNNLYARLILCFSLRILDLAVRMYSSVARVD